MCLAALSPDSRSILVLNNVRMVLGSWQRAHSCLLPVALTGCVPISRRQRWLECVRRLSQQSSLHCCCRRIRSRCWTRPHALLAMGETGNRRGRRSSRGTTCSAMPERTPPRRRSMLAFVSFAPTLDLFGEGTEIRCVLHACISYVFIGTLARRKKTILSKLAIIIRVRHYTPYSAWPIRT